jgi:hypothetical protein
VTILEEHPEIAVRQHLGDHAFHLDSFLLRHIRSFSCGGSCPTVAR